MINQHQFQQAAKHYRSGRISLSEFQSLASAGIQTKTGKTDPVQRRDTAITIQQGDTTKTLINTLGQLKATGQSVLVTGVCDALGAQLTQQIADGEFDCAAHTFACKNEVSGGESKSNLAIIAIVDVPANFRTGYLAAIVASE